MAIQAYQTQSPWSMTEMGRGRQLKQEEGQVFGAVRYVQGRPYVAAMKKSRDSRSPTWSPLISPNNTLGSPPRSPKGSRLIPIQHVQGSGATYRFPFNVDVTKDPVSRLNPENHIVSPTSPVPGTSRGSSIVLYGTLRTDTYQRPGTTPKPYKLSTPLRSRRPQSVQGSYPPGKDPGSPLSDRLALRHARQHPPKEMKNFAMGTVRVMVRDMQGPGQAPKEGEFSRMSDAVARGNIFARSFNGAKPCLI